MAILPAAVRNEYATRCLRDQADQDYIASRLCHANELDQQFLWLALQAIEKYLKAILLYNQKDSREFDHRVADALEAVKAIADLRIDIPPDVERFVEYLQEYGANRYIISSTSLRMDALPMLDRTVWYIRRYCLHMRYTVLKGGKEMSMLPVYLSKIENKQYKHRPHKYSIHGGLLESLLRKRSAPGKALAYKNLYFGLRHRGAIKNYTFRSSSFTPIHELHPETFPELAKYVKFPKGMRAAYHALIAKGRKKS